MLSFNGHKIEAFNYNGDVVFLLFNDVALKASKHTIDEITEVDGIIIL